MSCNCLYSNSSEFCSLAIFASPSSSLKRCRRVISSASGAALSPPMVRQGRGIPLRASVRCDKAANSKALPTSGCPSNDKPAPKPISKPERKIFSGRHCGSNSARGWAAATPCCTDSTGVASDMAWRSDGNTAASDADALSACASSVRANHSNSAPGAPSCPNTSTSGPGARKSGGASQRHCGACHGCCCIFTATNCAKLNAGTGTW